MKFYHYSTVKFDSIKTLNMLRKESDTSNKLGDRYVNNYRYINGVKYYYGDSVSLFFEKIPTDIIGKLYKNHPFWKPNIKLFQYIVDESAIEKNIVYRIIETPLEDEIYHEFKHKNNITNTQLLSGKTLINYNRYNDDRLSELGLYGKGLTNLKKYSKPYTVDIKESFKKSAMLYPNSKKYALKVPHLVIYPEFKLKIESTTEVVI